MTTAEFHRDGASGSIEIRGHTCFAAKGEPDIVCSAVSVLGYSLLGFLGRSERVDLKTSTVSPGLIRAEYSVKDEKDRVVPAVINAFSDGFRMLSEMYPENVTVRSIVGSNP